MPNQLVRTLGLLALLLVSSNAAAQTQSPRPRAAPGADDGVARGLFQAAKAAYESGNYEDALEFFDQAYERSSRPQLLFNIGQVADRLRMDDRALSAFRAYLQQVPNAPNRAEVESRIAALERSQAARNAAAQPVIVAPPPSAAPTPVQTAEQASVPASDPALTQSDSHSTPVTEKWWFWTGIGAVVVGGTAVALALALGGDDVSQAPYYQGNAGSLQGP